MQEMCVQYPGQEDSLEEEMATHPIFLPGKSLQRGAWQAIVHGAAKGQTWLSNWTTMGGMEFSMLYSWFIILYEDFWSLNFKDIKTQIPVFCVLDWVTLRLVTSESHFPCLITHEAKELEDGLQMTSTKIPVLVSPLTSCITFWFLFLSCKIHRLWLPTAVDETKIM